MKESGIGREKGRYGVEAYLEYKTHLSLLRREALMTAFLREADLPIWLAARPWLDVRSNDEHTLISYRLGQALLRVYPDVDPSVVLPAILMHDVGWKKFPPEQLAHAVGPNPKYPELQRAHEIEGVKIAGEVFARLAIPGLATDAHSGDHRWT